MFEWMIENWTFIQKVLKYLGYAAGILAGIIAVIAGTVAFYFETTERKRYPWEKEERRRLKKKRGR